MKHLTRKQKFIYTGLLAFCTMFTVAFLRENMVLNISILATCSVLMMLVDGNKHIVRLFFAGFILGPLAEAFCIYFGAWSYSESFILGFPIYLPFVWGNAAILFKRLTYQTE